MGKHLLIMGPSENNRKQLGSIERVVAAIAAKKNVVIYYSSPEEKAIYENDNRLNLALQVTGASQYLVYKDIGDAVTDNLLNTELIILSSLDNVSSANLKFIYINLCQQDEKFGYIFWLMDIRKVSVFIEETLETNYLFEYFTKVFCNMYPNIAEARYNVDFYATLIDDYKVYTSLRNFTNTDRSTATFGLMNQTLLIPDYLAGKYFEALVVYGDNDASIAAINPTANDLRVPIEFLQYNIVSYFQLLYLEEWGWANGMGEADPITLSVFNRDMEIMNNLLNSWLSATGNVIDPKDILFGEYFTKFSESSLLNMWHPDILQEYNV